MNDDELLGQLRVVLDQVDPDTHASRAAAVTAYEWRLVDYELAELLESAAEEEPQLVFRGRSAPRASWTFRTGNTTIEIEVDEGTLVGRIEPPAPAVIEVHNAGVDVQRRDVDEHGDFVFTDIARGVARVVCSAIDGSWSIQTDWTIT